MKIETKIKFLLSLTLLLGGVGAAQGASFSAVNDGSWSASFTWTRTSGTDTDGIPDADDTVTISNARVVTVSGNQAVLNLTLNPGSTLTLNANSVLTIDDGSFAASNATFSGTGLFRLSGATSINISSTVVPTPVEVASGTLTFQSPASFTNSMTILSGATFNHANLSIAHSGNLTVNSGGTITNAAGSYNFTGATLVNNGTISSTFNRNFTFQRSGTTALSGTGRFSGETRIITPGSVQLGSDHQMQTLFANNGTLNTSVYALSLDGAGDPVSYNGAVNSPQVRINYNGTAAQTVETNFFTYSQLGVDNTAGVTLSAAETVTQRLRLLRGTFNNGSFLTMAGGSTIERAFGTLQNRPARLGQINVEYWGASNNQFSDNEIPTAGGLFDLIINKSSAANNISLDESVTVNNRLRLLTGNFNRSGGGVVLTMAANTTVERDSATIAFAPTLAGNISLEYSGSTDIVTGIEFPTTGVVNDLAINKTASTNTVTLNASRTLLDDLTLTNGRLATGSFQISVPSAGTSTGSENGFVIGNINKTFNAPGAFTFHVGTADGYSPATINVDSGTGNFAVSAADGIIPGSGLDPTRTLQRYWNLTSSGITQADIAFVYPQDDVPLTASEASFRFIRNNGGASNAEFVPTSLDTTANTAVLNNVAQFSPWTLRVAVPTSAPANLGGRIARADGAALAGVQIKLFNPNGQTILETTDASGDYLFPAMPTGAAYIVTPSRRGYKFDPVSRVLNHRDETTDLNFTATRDLSRQEATGGSDFDGDGKADLAVFRPANGTWYIKRSSDDFFVAQQFGANGDVPTAGDYDGDGRSDYAVYRPADGVWYQLRSADSTFAARQFGAADDRPAHGDYDGDGVTDIAVYRPSEGVWCVAQSSNGQVRYERFGAPDDEIVPADYDGDGTTDVAVYRPSNGVWYILQSSDGQMRAERFGVAADRPVAADFDGDGKTDIAVFRATEGTWHVLESARRTHRAIRWGQSGDALAPADYDGDGRADAAVFRDGIWHISTGGNRGNRSEQFGQTNDVPVPKSF